MDVKELLIETILPLVGNDTNKVLQQGSLSNDAEYPDSFFTFWNNDTLDDAFYSNDNTQTVWDFDLNYYSTDPASVNSVLLEAKVLLKAVGFIPDGSGHDVMSDEPTHTGRGMNLLFIEKVR